MKEYRLTREGLNKLLKEKEELINVKRKEIAERLKEAKERSGDLSENTEYEYAKNEQAFIEGRIEQIDDILDNHVIIEENKQKGVIDIGSTVVVKDLSTGKQKKFMIVSSVESDPENNKISDESPMGRALVNRETGDEVTIKTPKKTFGLKVVKIE
ncbi:MAG: transcription elongation factor GreA [Actinobacteria bacterium]|nr:transcription elongation factor GreA [Actinomycetota bacterium]